MRRYMQKTERWHDYQHGRSTPTCKCPYFCLLPCLPSTSLHQHPAPQTQLCHVHTHTHTLTHKHLCTYTSPYTGAHTHILYRHTNTHTFVWTHIHSCTHTSIYMHAHTHTFDIHSLCTTSPFWGHRKLPELIGTCLEGWRTRRSNRPRKRQEYC